MQEDYSRLRWVLSTSKDLHLSIFWLWYCNTSLCFQIKVFLTAHSGDACEDVVSTFEGFVSITLVDVSRMLEETLLLNCFLDCEYSRQFLVVYFDSPCSC